MQARHVPLSLIRTNGASKRARIFQLVQEDNAGHAAAIFEIKSVLVGRIQSTIGGGGIIAKPEEISRGHEVRKAA